jgi:protein Mpv17
MYYWFGFLDRWGTIVGKPALSVARRVGLNQVTMAPAMNSLFFGYVLATDGGNNRSLARFLERWREKLQLDFWPTTLRSCLIWTPAHIVNFYFVPGHLRVLYLSTGLAAWTCYLSLVGHRDHEQGDS